MPAAVMAGSSCALWPNLYEFLLEAELDQYYNALRNDLKVASTAQLKYVQENDLSQLGMTKPEQRRLRKFYNKYHPQNYIMKIKKMILPKSKDDADRSSVLLLGETSPERASVRVPSKHIISADNIVVNKELGVGEFGVVQQGIWTNEDGERIQVAIKCLSKDRLQNDYSEFLKEAAIMHTIDHDNIVRLYGAVLDTSTLMLVTELAPLRSLLECLKEPALRSSFPVLSLCDFALQICNGMEYVERKRLIHRDLAARNVLVFAKNKVKISDFGLSRALGVGKDYYQTNFNVNLKLPIAWCAPECINYLRFTSASDVWAYGVTLWEMFSYGFQPWAALTGQQILEAIDEPNFQRLEQPECCPREYYMLMLKCWQHDPAKRPKFQEILNMLPDCKAEQVQTVKDFVETSPGSKPNEYLFYKIGDIITVLDKRTDNGHMWKGALNNGKTGLFNPSNTVAYLGQNLPTNRPSFSKADSRSSLYASRRSRLRPDMISKPQGDLKHTGHVGLDGAFFGDISFLDKPQEDREMSSLSRASSELSDKAPLLAKSHSLFDRKGGPDSDTWSVAEKKDTFKTMSADTVDSNSPKCKVNGTEPKSEHEYHEISDDDFDFDDPFASIESPRFESLDFGPSLMDEVFKALSSTTSANTTSRASVSSTTASDFESEQQSNENSNFKNEIQEIASKAMGKEGGKRKQSTVKPISAADHQTLESAIAMAKELASKSMLELDGEIEAGSPHTPNSPNKRKFSFKFKSSPKQERRNFSEEAESISDIQDTLSEEAKEAYNSLVEKGDAAVVSPPIVHDTRNSSSLRASLRSYNTENVDEESESVDSNPLRLLKSGVPVRPKVRGNKHAFPGTGRANTPHTAAVARLAANASLLSTGQSMTTGGRGSLGAPPPPPSPTAFGSVVGQFESQVEGVNGEAVGATSNLLPLPPRDRSKPPPPVLKCHQRKYPLVLPGTISSDTLHPIVKQTLSSDEPPPMPTYCNVIARGDQTIIDTCAVSSATSPECDSSPSSSKTPETVLSRLTGSKKNSR